jgi:hypothetical protein
VRHSTRAYKSAIEKYEYNQYKQDILDVFWFIERNGLKVNSAFEKILSLGETLSKQVQQIGHSLSII